MSILNVLGSAYGALASGRRRWYATHPGARRRLTQPVVSVGSLRVGGSGKTPAVCEIARLLAEAGERPAVLTRGYARRVAPPGVTVVSDGTSILADVGLAGDEPLMMARALPHVPVLVGADRYLSGLLAERQFETTVHVLDDGFQHLPLARDVELLLVEEEDLDDLVLPAGRLREPLAAARVADAVLVGNGRPDGSGDDARVGRVAARLGVGVGFGAARSLGDPRPTVALPREARAFAIAGVARPDRFFADLAAQGWQIAGTLAFPDHHWYSQSDVDRVVAAAHAVDAAMVLTTAKDEVRLEGYAFGGLARAVVPMSVAIVPAGAFAEWLRDRLARARVTA